MHSLNLKYRQLKAFTFAVETGSFKKAADQMAVTQPSFSVLIRELEQDTGVQLFVRSARRCTPTSDALAFYDQIRGALAHLEDAYRYIRDVGVGTRGRLSLTALPSLSSGVVADRLGQFQRRFPQVRIALSERKHDQVMAAVRQGEVEFGIGSMMRADPDLVFEPLFKDQLMIVAPPGHPVLQPSPATWKSLDSQSLVLLTGGPAEIGLKASGVRSLQVLEVEQASTAVAMVRNGIGVTVLPSAIAIGTDVSGLVMTPIRGRTAVRQLGVIRKKGIPLSTVARAFVDSLAGVELPQGATLRPRGKPPSRTAP